MNKDLLNFAAQWLGVATMTMVPVVLTVYISLPMSLGRYPGEPAPASPFVQRYMT